MAEFHKKNYAKNKDVILKKHADYRDENQEQYKKSKRESWLKHKDKYLKTENERRLKYKRLNPEKIKARETKRKDELQDSYVRKVLLNRTNLRSEDIPYSLIEMKRALMLLKRGIKDCKEKERAEQLRSLINEIEKDN